MKRKVKFLLLLLFLALLHVEATAQQGGLEVRFGDQGLDAISYGGRVVEDVTRWPEDRFHIWHMRCFDMQGKAPGNGECSWGENSRDRTWAAGTRAWTYRFGWGTIRASYTQNGNTLDVHVTTSNRAGSGVKVDGASIYPLALHLPGAVRVGGIMNGVDAPNVSSVRWSGGLVALVAPVAGRVLYSGFHEGKDESLEMIVSGTKPDAVPESEERGGRLVPPGGTDSFVVSLRFGGPSSTVAKLSGDADKNWTEHWPQKLTWTDRRVIGTAFLASSAQGEKSHRSGFPSNPRRYFAENTIDVKSKDGLRQFQARLLEKARTIVRNLKRINAQGVMVWDTEGQEYPQDTSYVCSPDQIAQVAPEMESVLDDEGQYSGMKLDDAYFKIIRDAGFRVGVCVRPQRFVMRADGTAAQQFLPDGEVAGELIRKMRYAHDRWGATMFYMDSTVRAGGSVLPASVIEEAAQALPDSLLIPEEWSARMYRASAPFMSFLFHGHTGTDEGIRQYYASAFGVNLVNDVDAGKLEAHRIELVDAVRHGDVLMVHADFWHPNNDTVMSIYREASRAK